MELRDSLFGAVVVKLGLCSAADVEEALALQKKYRDNWQKAPKLGEALASLGKISPEQVQAVLAGNLNQKPGRRFGEFLVGLKLVDNKTVKKALEKQKTNKRPLGRIMVEEGRIREEHIPVVLSAQGLTPVYCGKCNIIYNVPSGMRNDFYVCPECSETLGDYPLKSEAEPQVKPVEPPPEEETVAEAATSAAPPPPQEAAQQPAPVPTTPPGPPPAAPPALPPEVPQTPTSPGAEPAAGSAEEADGEEAGEQAGKPVQEPSHGSSGDLPEVTAPAVSEEEELDIFGEPIPVGEAGHADPGETAMEAETAFPVSPLSPGEGVEAAPPALSDDNAGDMYGPFKIIEAIGEDSHSVLYRAEDTRNGTLVALRMFPDPILNTPEQLEVMRNARKRLAGIKHSGIKKILEVGERDGVNYIVEEFVVGKSLRSFLYDDDRIHLRTATNIIMQAAEALYAAHKAGVYHLGVRPSLIIIQPNGKVRVGGFGYPKDAISDMRRMAERAGEVSVYAAPELAVEGMTRDHRADIYSLGAVYYHLVTGQAPFKGESVGELLLRMSAEEAQPAATHRDDLPVKVNDLISRMLSVEPEERPESLKDVLMMLHGVEDLESGMEPAVLSFPEEEAQPEGIPPGTGRRARPRRAGKRRSRTSRAAITSRRGIGGGTPRRGQPSSRRPGGMSAGTKGILVIGILIAVIVAAIGLVLILSASQ